MSREATAELSPHLIADFHHPLPETGYLRLHQIIGRPARNGWPAIPALIPVSRSTWWAGVTYGRYPQPVHTLGPNIPAWRDGDVRALTEESDRRTKTVGESRKYTRTEDGTGLYPRKKTK